MHNDTPKPRRPGRSAVGFAAGLAAGVVLATAAFAIVVFRGDLDKLRETVIYAVSALAVDTERNAHKIVTLEERIDDLESRLAELTKRAK